MSDVKASRYRHAKNSLDDIRERSKIKEYKDANNKTGSGGSFTRTKKKEQ